MYSDVVTTCCNVIGRRDDLFTFDGVCTQCGTVSDDNACRIDENELPHRPSPVSRLVTYDPRFYVKERLCNWKCDCPVIPNEHFKAIIQEIVHEIGRVRGFGAGAISRTLIYNVVNRLFGSSPLRSPNTTANNRRFLVYRERWLMIKKWMCEQSIFEIPDAQEWLKRYHAYEPTKELIFMIERLMKVLESSFKIALFSKKKEGLLRPNRPRRDVAILFLLYGLHPALSVIYGTDYWKPPTTKKSRDENSQRFKILLAHARRQEPMLYWPADDVTLDHILTLNTVQIGNVDEIPAEIECLFPSTLQSGMIFNRDDCCLF